MRTSRTAAECLPGICKAPGLIRCTEREPRGTYLLPPPVLYTDIDRTQEKQLSEKQNQWGVKLRPFLECFTDLGIRGPHREGDRVLVPPEYLSQGVSNNLRWQLNNQAHLYTNFCGRVLPTPARPPSLEPESCICCCYGKSITSCSLEELVSASGCLD